MNTSQKVWSGEYDEETLTAFGARYAEFIEDVTVDLPAARSFAVMKGAEIASNYYSLSGNFLARARSMLRLHSLHAAATKMARNYEEPMSALLVYTATIIYNLVRVGLFFVRSLFYFARALRAANFCASSPSILSSEQSDVVSAVLEKSIIFRRSALGITKRGLDFRNLKPHTLAFLLMREYRLDPASRRQYDDLYDFGQVIGGFAVQTEHLDDFNQASRVWRHLAEMFGKYNSLRTDYLNRAQQCARKADAKDQLLKQSAK